MNWHHRLKRIVVTGMSGSGKTTLAIRLIQAHRARWLFIFDPEREFSQKLRVPPSTLPTDMARRAARCDPVCFDPSAMFPGDLEAGFSFFCRWVLDFCRITHDNKPAVNGIKLFVADELQNYTTTGKGGIPKEFAELLNQGRRQEIDTIFTSQAPNFVHQNIRLQATDIYTLHHEEDSILDWLASDFRAEDVRRLAVPGGFLHRRRIATPDGARTGDHPAADRAQGAKADRGRAGDRDLNRRVPPAERAAKAGRPFHR